MSDLIAQNYTTYGVGPDKQTDEMQSLRDERDRLRDELDVYRQAVQYVFEAINKFEDIQRKKAALTPAGGGGKNE